MSDEVVERRLFLRASVHLVGAATAVLVGLPGLGFLLTPVTKEDEELWVDLGDAAELAANGRPIELRFHYEALVGYVRGRKPGLVLVVPEASAESGVRVLSAVCTHKSCNVSWSPEEELFACPCHKGRFDIQGAPVSGPPDEPLHALDTEVRDGRVWARLGGVA